MSGSGFPEHASGKTLQEDCEVPMNASFQSVPAEKRPTNVEPADEQRYKPAGTEEGQVATGNKPVGCSSSACSNCKQQTWWMCVMTVLVLVCLSSLYSVHIDYKYSSQVEDLRQELKQLARHCHSGHKSGNSDSDVDFAATVPGDGDTDRRVSPHPSTMSSKQAGVDDSEEGMLMFSKQANHGWGNENAKVDLHDDDDEDDSDDDDDDDDSNADELDAATKALLHRIRRNSPASTAKPKKQRRRKKKKPKRGGQRCKRVLQCLKKRTSPEPIPLPLSQAPTSPPPPPPPPPFVPKAVHFFSDFWNGSRQFSFGRDACVYVKEWKATACRNRTARFHEDKTPLKFLQAADWMRQVYRSESEQPIQAIGDGRFLVKESGLYLIYSSVMFHDLKPRQSLAVVVNGDKLFKCMDSVDYVDVDMPSDQEQAKYKTCTVTGVTHLMAGKHLEVQNLYGNTQIDLSTDATYFGAILFSPGLVKNANGQS